MLVGIKVQNGKFSRLNNECRLLQKRNLKKYHVSIFRRMGCIFQVLKLLSTVVWIGLKSHKLAKIQVLCNHRQSNLSWLAQHIVYICKCVGWLLNSQHIKSAGWKIFQKLIKVQVGISVCRLENFEKLIRFAALLFKRAKQVYFIAYMY